MAVGILFRFSHNYATVTHGYLNSLTPSLGKRAACPTGKRVPYCILSRSNKLSANPNVMRLAETSPVIIRKVRPHAMTVGQAVEADPYLT
jgi:hypothetical protein